MRYGQRCAALLRRRRALPPAYTFAHAEAQAFVGRMAATPSIAYRAAYDTFVGRLKSGRLNGSSLLGAFDVFYVRAASSPQAALLNLAGGSYTATLSPIPPTFHPGYGFTTNGMDGYVEWGGWAPSAGVQYTQNSASFGVFSRRPDVLAANTGSVDAGPTAGTQANGAHIFTRNSAGNAAFRINAASATNAGALADGSGLFVAVRPDSATQRLYRAGTQVGSDAAVASAARNATVVREGLANTGTAAYSQNQLAFSFVGRALTAAEVADLNDAMTEYLAAIGGASALVALPDNPLGTFSGDNLTPTGKGFTNTGLARDPRDGTWWVSGFGRNVQGNTTRTFEPRIVHLAADRATVLGVIDLTAAGVPAAGLQGLAFDSSNNTLWFALASGYIGNVAATNGASSIISTFSVASANAIAYDSKRDKLVLGVSTIGYYNKDGTTAGVPSIRATIPGSYVDQVTYAADLDGFLVTGGPNGSAGVVTLVQWAQNYAALRYTRLDLLTGSNTIEGIDRTAGVLTIGNDNWYHGNSSAPANGTVSYAAPY